MRGSISSVIREGNRLRGFLLEEHPLLRMHQR